MHTALYNEQEAYSLAEAFTCVPTVCANNECAGETAHAHLLIRCSHML